VGQILENLQIGKGYGPLIRVKLTLVAVKDNWDRFVSQPIKLSRETLPRTSFA
jgi:hypothetical protein